MKKYIEQDIAIEQVGDLVATMSVCTSTDECFGMKSMKNRALDTLHNIPVADVVEVQHGRWISDSPGKRFGTVVRLDKDGCPVGSCHCSECGEWLTASDKYPVIGYYCPNCGAKMDLDGIVK